MLIKPAMHVWISDLSNLVDNVKWSQKGHKNIRLHVARLTCFFFVKVEPLLISNPMKRIVTLEELESNLIARSFFSQTRPLWNIRDRKKTQYWISLKWNREEEEKKTEFYRIDEHQSHSTRCMHGFSWFIRRQYVKCQKSLEPHEEWNWDECWRADLCQCVRCSSILGRQQSQSKRPHHLHSIMYKIG